MSELNLGENASGVDDYVTFDADGTIVVRSVQDIEAIVEHNKRLQNDGTNGWSPTKEWKRKASIPLNVIVMWSKKYGLKGMEILRAEHHKLLNREIEDSDNRFFRTDK